ncbi:hypothetical protein BDN72DRAFT_864193 [Pluteus cervinus]|uniref:Uncharacterized protein n=1 Tax=Pluteus cervinus TaxID=181527 RepID=A0ACD3A4K9_9AGAR|nr:hypothetical protein BDN72DRAFT_864193 [Pluteus cervinus]
MTNSTQPTSEANVHDPPHAINDNGCAVYCNGLFGHILPLFFPIIIYLLFLITTLPTKQTNEFDNLHLILYALAFFFNLVFILSIIYYQVKLYRKVELSLCFWLVETTAIPAVIYVVFYQTDAMASKFMTAFIITLLLYIPSHAILHSFLSHNLEMPMEDLGLFGSISLAAGACIRGIALAIVYPFNKLADSIHNNSTKNAAGQEAELEPLANPPYEFEDTLDDSDSQSLPLYNSPKQPYQQIIDKDELHHHHNRS